MKKFFAFLLVVLMLAAAMPVALAENTTTLTTTVPDATYTLNIPADQEIAFGATQTNIGTVTVTDASGFAEGKNLAVTVTYGDFIAEDVETTIPMMLNCEYHPNRGGTNYEYLDISSGIALIFRGNANGSVNIPTSPNFSNYELNSISVKVASVDWGKALGGNYSAVITFTAEVVKGE